MLFLALLACADAPEEAPPSAEGLTLDDMTAGAIQEFHEPSASERMSQLHAWLVENAPAWAEPDWTGGYRLGPIEEADVSNIEHSDNTNWNEVLGAGVPLVMRGTLDGYADAAVETDQSFADPETYIEWTRTITGGTAEGFLAGGEMQTDNVIEKGGPLGVVIPYEANKDFAWFVTPEGVDVLAARTWVPEEGWGEDGENGIVCGFTIELWFEEAGEVIWYNGSWTQIATVIGDEFPEDLLVGTFIDGTIDYMLGTEAFVMGEYTPE